MNLTINGDSHQTKPETQTVQQLLEELGLSGKFVAVEKNRELITKLRFSETVLQEGDSLEIVTLVGGG